MRTRVEVSPQVVQYVQSLPPGPRRTLRLAIRGLARGRGDVRALEGELADFSRLRVGAHRVVFHVEVRDAERLIRCDYAEKRSVVYEVFAEILQSRIIGGERDT
jgi:mRNA-degrading endonuclease RelE of RelBE toxin-antitoxin system